VAIQDSQDSQASQDSQVILNKAIPASNSLLALDNILVSPVPLDNTLASLVLLASILDNLVLLDNILDNLALLASILVSLALLASFLVSLVPQASLLKVFSNLTGRRTCMTKSLRKRFSVFSNGSQASIAIALALSLRLNSPKFSSVANLLANSLPPSSLRSLIETTAVRLISASTRR
jgi:hypothetical protein